MPSNINPESNKMWKKEQKSHIFTSITKHLVDAKILKSGVVDQKKVRHGNEELEVTKNSGRDGIQRNRSKDW